MARPTKLTPELQATGGKLDASASGEAAAEWVPIESLKPWSDNPRLNDGEPVERVMASIKRFGFASPIIARRADGEVIAGHTRLKAAEALGLKTVPVRFMDLDPADAHLLALADNRLNEFAGWGQPKLQELMSQFSLPDIDLAGWSSDDLSKLAADVVSEPAGSDTDDDGLRGENGFEYESKYAVVIECDGEEEQRSTFEALTALGYNCRPVSV